MVLWVEAYAEEYTYLRMTDPLCHIAFLIAFSALAICAYRADTTQLFANIFVSAQNSTHRYMFRIASYLRLVVLAVGFQHTANTQVGLRRDSAVVLKSVHAAREVIQIMVERLYPTGNLSFALQANFLYVSFAAAFLINVSPITPPSGCSY
jgi:hypothetical protein